jgi:hypothetical protein
VKELQNPLNRQIPVLPLPHSHGANVSNNNSAPGSGGVAFANQNRILKQPSSAQSYLGQQQADVDSHGQIISNSARGHVNPEANDVITHMAQPPSGKKTFHRDGRRGQMMTNQEGGETNGPILISHSESFRNISGVKGESSSGPAMTSISKHPISMDDEIISPRRPMYPNETADANGSGIAPDINGSPKKKKKTLRIQPAVEIFGQSNQPQALVSGSSKGGASSAVIPTGQNKLLI